MEDTVAIKVNSTHGSELRLKHHLELKSKERRWREDWCWGGDQEKQK